MSLDSPTLIQKYKETKDIDLRNDIVLMHMNIVKFVAVSLRNIYYRYADQDDIINEGVIALINAIETFDLERNVKFETYANIKVKGAIIDFVRQQDWVPRNVRKFGKELDETYNRLFTKLGRHPKNQEIADSMGLTIEKLAKNMADSAASLTLSFEELLYEDNFDSRSSESGDEADKNIYAREQKQIIAEAIDSLKPKEKQVVSLHYYEKLKFSDIAKVLGVSESRICQIHSKTMLLLKRKLEDYIRR